MLLEMYVYIHLLFQHFQNLHKLLLMKYLNLILREAILNFLSFLLFLKYCLLIEKFDFVSTPEGVSCTTTSTGFSCDIAEIKKGTTGEIYFDAKIKDFAELYLPEWSNAICKERKELDVLGMGAYENEKLVGLAACSADCDDMWQIGIDVLPEYRRNGIASAITTRLAAEIMKKGKVPFYCTAWSNIRSVRNAYKCGFIPAWVEMTIKPLDAINKMNEEEA